MPPRGTSNNRHGAAKKQSASTYRFENDRLDLPVILLAALAECDVRLTTFVDRIRRRSIWQDEAIRSADRRIVIQGHLAQDGLRCVIQIGRDNFFHHPGSQLHLWHVVLPATVMALRDMDASAVFDEPLLHVPGIKVRRFDDLNPNVRNMGTMARLKMPAIGLWLPAVRGI